MPLYEYECRECRRTFEQIERFSDPPQETCVVCGGPVSRLISAPAIQFKGSGWYVTDYARKGSSSAAESASGNGKPEKSKKGEKSEKKESTATESTPAKG